MYCTMFFRGLSTYVVFLLIIQLLAWSFGKKLDEMKESDFLVVNICFTFSQISHISCNVWVVGVSFFQMYFLLFLNAFEYDRYYDLPTHNMMEKRKLICSTYRSNLDFIYLFIFFKPFSSPYSTQYFIH